ncbi:unnamed protein product [Gadus morhua 'NCC']
MMGHRHPHARCGSSMAGNNDSLAEFLQCLERRNVSLSPGTPNGTANATCGNVTALTKPPSGRQKGRIELF